MTFSILKTSVNGRILAIGDIHGCYEELELLIDKLESDLKLTVEDTLIFLGDYIDRGPDSKLVVDFLLSIKVKYPRTRFLKGNHEDMLLDFLGLGGHYGEWFIVNGGRKTLKNYGLKSNCWRWKRNQSLRETAEIDPRFSSAHKIAEQISNEHIEFFKNLETGLIHDNFVFVHAGINPNKLLENQSLEDLCWIREDFLMWPHNFSETIVHGHSPTRSPYFDKHLNRVNIDTGCFKGGSLSAVELRSMKFFSVDSRQPNIW